MAAILMNLLLWLSWFSGGGIQFNATSGQEALAQKGYQTQPGRLPINGAVIKPTDDVVFTSTIVLEDDTHFRPFYTIKK